MKQQRRGHLEQARRDRGVRRGLRSSGAAATVVMVAVAGGVVAAAPPLPDPMPKPGDVKTGIFADKSRAQATREGYAIRANLFGIHVRSIAPLGRALNSYQTSLEV